MASLQPLNTYTYTLEFADALAYERLPAKMIWQHRIGLVIWLGLAGVALGMLPASVVGSPYGIQYWLMGGVLLIIQYGLFRILRDVRRWRRARLRVPLPIKVRLEQWPDCLEVTEGDKRRTVIFTAIEALLPTEGYLFVAVDKALVIVPRRAFANDEAIPELAETIDAYVRARLDND